MGRIRSLIRRLSEFASTFFDAFVRDNRVLPPVAALLALVFLGEVLSFTQCVAIALIMTASMGCALTAQARRAKPVSVVAEAA